MNTLGQVNAGWAGDRGEADERIRAAVAVAGTSQDAYLRAIAALCGARLLLPIVASGDETGERDPSRQAEMSAVLLTAPTGERALLAFTGADALTAFDPAARPVLCTLDDAAAAAVDSGAAALLVDVAGPHQLVLEGELLTTLARGNRLVALADGWGWLSVTTDGATDQPSG